MDISNVGAAGGYQYQPKTAKDLKEEVRNTPDSEKKDLGVIVEISKDSPEARRLSETVQQRIQNGERGKYGNVVHRTVGNGASGKQPEEKINKVNGMMESVAKQIKIEQEKFYKEHGAPHYRKGAAKMKAQQPDGKAAQAQPTQADRAVNVTLSREGIETWQKQVQENGGEARTYEGVVKQKESIMQASKSIGVSYGYRLSEEAGKLKGQRDSGAAYSLSERAADYVKAYGNLYDEIVQGYKGGTMERYVEDAASETGYRRMTVEEVLADLDKDFQSMADKAEVDAKASKILDGYKEKLSKLKSGQKLSADADKAKTVQENVSQKLVTLAQAWKDAYQVSGSKEGGMEKALSMLSGMFGIKNEA